VSAFNAIWVPGVPAPQGSKRHVGNGILVESSKKVGPWRERVGLVFAEHYSEPTRGPVRCNIDFIFVRPSSHLRTNGEPRSSAPPYPGRRDGDLDKLVRAVLDAVTGIVFVDDTQVVSFVASKKYGKAGGALLKFWTEPDTNQGEEVHGTAHTSGADR
jgi:crossover junction endodeoxyribonuclease RusA